MRIAVFGGSFNPPHNGHLNLIRAVYEHGYADKLLLVPAFRPPHKPKSPLVDFTHRLTMTELSIAELNWAEVSDIERLRPNLPSYTFDTMCQFQKLYPDDSLILLIGADSLRSLHTWYRAAELVDKWQLLAYPRPGDNTDVSELQQHWTPEIAKRLAASIVPLPQYEISSTAIRTALSSGQDVASQIPAAVKEYIGKNHLYR